MMRIMLKSKIHRATVTDANLNYEGSLTVDRDLMDEVGLLPFERLDQVLRPKRQVNCLSFHFNNN